MIKFLSALVLFQFLGNEAVQYKEDFSTKSKWVKSGSSTSPSIDVYRILKNNKAYFFNGLDVKEKALKINGTAVSSDAISTHIKGLKFSKKIKLEIFTEGDLTVDLYILARNEKESEIYFNQSIKKIGTIEKSKLESDVSFGKLEFSVPEEYQNKPNYYLMLVPKKKKGANNLKPIYINTLEVY